MPVGNLGGDTLPVQGIADAHLTESLTLARIVDASANAAFAGTEPAALYARTPRRRRSSAVEQLIRNQQVLGSSPSVGTNKINELSGIPQSLLG